MKKFVEKKLARDARRLLKRTQPEIIGITGSVGKSSAKQAVAAVLGGKFRVGASPKNFNTELGLPLAILELPNGGHSVWRWLKIFKKAAWRSVFPRKDYPKVLVLEMAADHPGDIAYLTSIAPPKIGVVTAVGESHAEFFGSVENVAKEKQTLIQKLPKEGQAVLNRDEERVWQMKERSKAPVIGFGFHEEADVRALDVSMRHVLEADGGCGMAFKITAGGATVPVFLPGVIGKQSVYAALAAAAVGLAKGMNLVEISDGLAKYEPPPGRMRCLGGIKRTLLIDDTYNASPKSARAALETLRDLPIEEGKQKFAVLGDMLELGPVSVSGHEEIGKMAAEIGLGCLVLVGERMGDAKKAALAAGMPADKIFHFSKTEDAGRFVQERMHQGDIVLAKGSRGMHMECVVKELMAEPLRAAELLVEAHE